VTIPELRDLLAKLTTEAKSIGEKLKAEKRSSTADEAKRVDELIEQIEKTKTELAAAEREEERQRKLDALVVPPPSPPPAPAPQGATPPVGSAQQRSMTITAPRANLVAFREERDAYVFGTWLVANTPSHHRFLEARQWCRDQGIDWHQPAPETRAMGETTNTAGGYLVPTETAATIIDLAERFGVARANCQVIQMTRDNLTVPKYSSGPTAYWVAENGTITASDVSLDAVGLVAKKLATLTRISTELMEDSAVAVGDFVAMQAARRLAEAEDDAWINGDGTSTYGGIFGVRGQFNANESLEGAVTAASGNDTFAEYTVADLSKLMGTVAPMAYSMGGPKWFTSQAGRANTLERLGQQGGGTTVATIQQGLIAFYSGWPIVITNKLPTTTGDQSENTPILFGNMELGCMFGDRRRVTVKILTELYAATDQIGILVTERVDINFHEAGSATVAGVVVGLMGD